MFRNLTVLTLMLFSSLSLAEPSGQDPQWCDSHREFVTTLEYMRNQDFYELGEQHSRQVAKQVSEGCTGAAKRYVRVYELLKKVEAGARTSIETAVEMAHATDSKVVTFMNVFRNAYSQNKLDLDVANSLKIAKGLSIDYKGDADKAKRDYDRLVAFCLNESKIGGSIPVCASIAFDVAKSAEHFRQPAAPAFIEMYEFLKNHKKLNFQISKAIEVSKKVVAIHPMAAKNYVAAFEYATSKDGLNIPADQTLAFAYDIAANTRPALSQPQAPDRLPANQKE